MSWYVLAPTLANVVYCRRVPFLTPQAKVIVSATVKPRMYLHFPDLDPNATGKPQMLEIGHCYMPGLVSAQTQQQLANLSGRGGNAGLGSEIVRPLHVRNVSDRKLYLTCTPNLKKQCFVYAEIPSDRSSAAAAAAAAALRDHSKALGEDKGAGQDVGWDGADVDGAGGDWSASAPRPHVADLPLLPQSEITLFIGLRPVLPTEAYTTGLVTPIWPFFHGARFCFVLSI